MVMQLGINEAEQQMKSTKYKTILFFVIAMFFISLTLQTSNGETAQSTVIESFPLFLNDVLGIETSNYELTSQSYGYRYPSMYGGLVKEESACFSWNSSEGDYIDAMSVFQNGFIRGIIIRLYGPVAYAQQYFDNSLEKMGDILLRYEAFAKSNGIPSDSAASALRMLSDDTLRGSNTTQGNVKMQFTSSIQTPDKKLSWVYTSNGVDAVEKCLSIEFDDIDGGVAVIFADTWGLWSVSDGGLSEAEATRIAWAAAKNCSLNIIKEDDSVTVLKPEWTTETPFTEVGVVMAPGQCYNDSMLNAHNLWSMGNASRDGLTLYPLWKFVFYFDKPQAIGNLHGIQVGVWGDTAEIAYCSGVGIYGEVEETSTSPPSTVPPTALPSIPELPAWVILPSVVVTAFILVLTKRRH
ncbi:MAG: hypothetical protein NWF05_07650 [Candidatus Bathyarchaeota archaeon]|nr:hypothetical protein [Candidatus Bathyarchaeota archaeon]